MMEFEDPHEVEDDEDEMEEDEEDSTIPQANYESSLPNSSSRPFKMPVQSPVSTEPRSPSPPPLPLSLSFPAGKKPTAPARYRECLKNHAVGIGGHAVDGCGEFMPAGPDGSLESLKCAACNCHRNFHRKEVVDPTSQQNHPILHNNNHQIQTPIAYFPNPHPQHPPHPLFQFYPYSRSAPGGYPNQRPLALPSTSGGGSRGGGEIEEAEMISDPMSAMGLGSSSGKKRFRTKFTTDQKEKMMELAEKVGWRLQKQDEGLIQHFCDETGIKRHVLKVWMHNNKHTLGKKNPS